MATWETVGGVLGELLGTVQAPPTGGLAVWISGSSSRMCMSASRSSLGNANPISVRATFAVKCSLGQVSHRRITRGAALLRLAKMPVWIS